MTLDSWVVHWIISFRSEPLTYFFKIFPLFAKESFYILGIALGYWWRQNRLFCEVGFLISFATLLSCTLKNFFALPRPNTFNFCSFALLF